MAKALSSYMLYLVVIFSLLLPSQGFLKDPTCLERNIQDEDNLSQESSPRLAIQCNQNYAALLVSRLGSTALDRVQVDHKCTDFVNNSIIYLKTNTIYLERAEQEFLLNTPQDSHCVFNACIKIGESGQWYNLEVNVNGCASTAQLSSSSVVSSTINQTQTAVLPTASLLLAPPVVTSTSLIPSSSSTYKSTETSFVAPPTDTNSSSKSTFGTVTSLVIGILVALVFFIVTGLVLLLMSSIIRSRMKHWKQRRNRVHRHDFKDRVILPLTTLSTSPSLVTVYCDHYCINESVPAMDKVSKQQIPLSFAIIDNNAAPKSLSNNICYSTIPLSHPNKFNYT